MGAAGDWSFQVEMRKVLRTLYVSIPIPSPQFDPLCPLHNHQQNHSPRVLNPLYASNALPELSVVSNQAMMRRIDGRLTSCSTFPVGIQYSERSTVHWVGKVPTIYYNANTPATMNTSPIDGPGCVKNLETSDIECTEYGVFDTECTSLRKALRAS